MGTMMIVTRYHYTGMEQARSPERQRHRQLHLQRVPDGRDIAMMIVV